MSYEIGWDTINLRPTARVAHTEYCRHNAPLMETVCEAASRAAGEPVGFLDAWEFDLDWRVDDGPINWAEAGRVTDMGHAEFQRDGVDKRAAAVCPFRNVEEVLAFDAVDEYGLPEFDALVDYYETLWQQKQAENPNQIYTAGYYKTIISGAIQAFGWDMLLEAAARRDAFETVLDSFFRRSLFYYRAWAQTSAPVFVCHDDMVWGGGPFMHPDVYRRVLFPRYRELWAVLKDAGKKVLFCSDGTWTEFLDDLVAAGADGFVFEPSNDFDLICERCGATHVIVGSRVDCRTLTFGTKDDIRREIDATLAVARELPGFMFAVGNHIPSNVPLDNALFYFDYLRSHWALDER